MDSNAHTDMPMKWHKFLIYFSLWAGAVICALNGLQLLTGTVYGPNNESEAVYVHFPALKSVDMVFGVIMIAIAVFLIYTRFQLARFREGAPNKLTIAYLLQLAAFLGYGIVISGIVHMSFSDVINSQTSASIVSSIVMIVVNRVYYNKRAHLFGDADAAASAPAPTYAPPASAPSATASGGFCPKCGAKSEPGDAFCVNCGAKLK